MGSLGRRADAAGPSDLPTDDPLEHVPVDATSARLTPRRRRPIGHGTVWLLRVLSVVAVLGTWEWYGRHTNPLLFTYPTIGAKQLVGTDLTQAVPLTLAAAIGAILFGHVVFGVTASLILGSVPAVLVGSLLSSTLPDRYVRPVITFVIFASGLKYVGVATAALGWVLCGVLLTVAAAWLWRSRPWRRPTVAAEER